MLTDLLEKEERKYLLCKSKKQNLEIYFYEESECAFSVCLLQNGNLNVYGSFSLKSVAKQMGYWLSGQLMNKEFVSKQEFVSASFEYGAYQWQL